jgi:uncharacterized protein with FMN-binding domain
MSPQNKSKIIGLVVVALLAVGATGGVIWFTRSGSVQQTETALDSPSTTAPYKDGTYTATGDYRSPGGNEKIGVTLTLADNTITDVSIETFGVDTAAQYQGAFKAGIRSVVVGKKADEVQVSRVSSSSLTSTGFNRALETIKREAKA